MNPRYRVGFQRKLIVAGTRKVPGHFFTSPRLTPVFVFQRKKSAVSYLNSPLHQGARKRGPYEVLTRGSQNSVAPSDRDSC